MDIKSKSFRKPSCFVRSAVCVASVVAAIIVGCMLGVTYHINESWHEPIKEVTEATSQLWIFEVIAIFAALVSLVLAMWTTGTKDGSGKIRLNWFDRIFTEIQICAGVLTGVCAGLLTMVVIDILIGSSWYDNLLSYMDASLLKEYEEWYMPYGSGFEPKWLEILLAALALAVCITATLCLLLSVVKKLKAGCFWRYTTIGRFACYIYETAKASEAVFWKLLLIMLAVSLLSATWVLLIPVLVLIFIFVPMYARKYTDIKEGVSQMKEGNLDYKIPVKDNGELDRLAMNINDISGAASIAMQNELKNQRMKTDLISNVSHDLRTPLTSMVSYVDLLKTEGLNSVNAPQYLGIIDEKTRRLQKLTEDLFEAAKASSGAIPVEMERIEMTSIVNQALAELEERLSASNLEVIFTNKADDVYVMADGQLLWRVIENLLVNVCKYALPGSRVYMDILERGGSMIVLEIKNMSKDQLNISADELMERFKRGDESRNTEGSGLGLSIAKDLTNLMQGEFQISIDGDLFKASVALERAE